MKCTANDEMYSVDLKAAALRAYSSVKSCRRVAQLLGLSKSTVQRWTANNRVARLANASNSSGIPFRTRFAKLKGSLTAYIHQLLGANPYVTPDIIRRNVQQHLNVALSASGVRHWMRRAGITRKKASKVYDRPGLSMQRLAFANDQLKRLSPENVVSIDESAFYFDMKPSHGYSHRSQRLRRRIVVVQAVANVCLC